MASKSIQTVGWHQVYFSPYNFYASLFPAPPLLFLSHSFPFPLERSSSSAATLPASLLRSSPLAALPARCFLATVPSPVSPPLPSVGLLVKQGRGTGGIRKEARVPSGVYPNSCLSHQRITLLVHAVQSVTGTHNQQSEFVDSKINLNFGINLYIISISRQYDSCSSSRDFPMVLVSLNSVQRIRSNRQISIAA